MIEREPTAEERIEAALICATEVAGSSPAMTLSNVMAALGFDFGEPEQIEHQVMQHYADPANNPFVQAQIEARLLLDVGHLERLAQAVKGSVGHKTMWMIHGRFGADIAHPHQIMCTEEVGLDCTARTFIDAMAYGISQCGLNRFNDAIGQAVDDFIKGLPDEALG